MVAVSQREWLGRRLVVQADPRAPLSGRPRQTYEILYRYQAYGISRVESRDDRQLARAQVGALASSNLGPCLFIATICFVCFLKNVIL